MVDGLTPCPPFKTRDIVARESPSFSESSAVVNVIGKILGPTSKNSRLNVTI
jgi:hypothetical protein